jgi:hypothetical protein
MFSSRSSSPRRGCRGPLVALFPSVAVMVIACGGGGGKNASTVQQPSKIGEEVAFKDSKWTVLEAKDMGTTLKSNNRFHKDTTTEGRFVQVHFKVLNTTGKEDRLMDLPKVIDSQQREFKEIDHESFYLPEGAKAMAIEALPPSISKEFYAIYEVPADAKGLKFEARSLSAFGDKTLVDLGL